jgi:hypothetical protein
MAWLICAQTGNLALGLETGTVDERDQPATYLCAPAVQLGTGDVGPDGLSQASPAYKAARGL